MTNIPKIDTTNHSIVMSGTVDIFRIKGRVHMQDKKSITDNQKSIGEDYNAQKFTEVTYRSVPTNGHFKPLMS